MVVGRVLGSARGSAAPPPFAAHTIRDARREVEESKDSNSQEIYVSHPAFPNDKHAPSGPPKGSPFPSIVSPVTIQFLSPEREPGLGQAPTVVTGVPMPEAAVDKNHTSTGSEDDIRDSGQVAGMQAKAVPQKMEKTSHRAFRVGVPLTHRGHQFAAVPLDFWLIGSNSPP